MYASVYTSNFPFLFYVVLIDITQVTRPVLRESGAAVETTEEVWDYLGLQLTKLPPTQEQLEREELWNPNLNDPTTTMIKSVSSLLNNAPAGPGVAFGRALGDAFRARNANNENENENENENFDLDGMVQSQLQWRRGNNNNNENGNDGNDENENGNGNDEDDVDEDEENATMEVSGVPRRRSNNNNNANDYDPFDDEDD